MENDGFIHKMIHLARYWSHKWFSKQPVPTSKDQVIDHSIIDKDAAMHQPLNGWHEHIVAKRQEAAFRELMRQMYRGQPRQDLLAAAEAVRLTGLESPSILEVGCGSGYYAEILTHLLHYPVRYTGLDYSQVMVHLAKKRYSSQPFLAGDATALPFPTGSFDIILNGGALVHISDYATAIAESCRVARHWCIFNIVPVLQNHQTTFLRKSAYGEPTIEVLFNETELHQLLEKNGLAIRNILDNIPYNLNSVLGEPKVTKTYVCELIGY